MINYFNKNLSKMKTYLVEYIPADIKRMHANETEKPILEYDILLKNLDKKLNFYPDEIIGELINNASNFYDIDNKKIIATNGSDEAIDLCIRTFCNPNDLILLIEPTFMMYKQYAYAFGVDFNCIKLKENDNYFIFDENEIIKTAMKVNAKMIFLPNPLANIGELVDKDKLIKIITSLPNTFLVVDEAYIEFCGLNKSMLDELKNYRNLIILRTFSKFFGLAGIRLGFIFTHFTNEIAKIKSPYNVNALTCQIGINVFQNINMKKMNERKNDIENKRKKIEMWIKSFPEVEKIFKSNTNFLFLKLSYNAQLFSKKLEKNFNIKIKPMSGEFENYCRISVL